MAGSSDGGDGFPEGDLHDGPDIDLTVLPDYIADEFHTGVTGLTRTLIDYYVEAVDSAGKAKRTPIQHVWICEGGSQQGWTIEGELDAGASLPAPGEGLDLYAGCRSLPGPGGPDGTRLPGTPPDGAGEEWDRRSASCASPPTAFTRRARSRS